jgi:hypothetical protein
MRLLNRFENIVMLNHYDLGLYVGWFEIPRDFIILPELYGLKCENLITLMIVLYLCSYNLDVSVTKRRQGR